MSITSIGTHQYEIGRLNVIQQFDVVRRLGIMSLILENELPDNHIEGARFIGALATGRLADMPQYDVDFIRMTCLGAVKVKRAENLPFNPIMDSRSGQMMFDDIDLPTMLELIDLVIQENLAPFFAKLRQDRTTPSPPPNPPNMIQPE